VLVKLTVVVVVVILRWGWEEERFGEMEKEIGGFGV
jgi:hypothetical protein